MLCWSVRYPVCRVAARTQRHAPTPAQDAPSGIPDQPFGDDQTLLGARNRVAALQGQAQGVASPAPAPASGHSAGPTAALLIAIEGGVGRAPPPPPGGASGAGDGGGGGAVGGSGGADGAPEALECFAWAVAKSALTGGQGRRHAV